MKPLTKLSLPFLIGLMALLGSSTGCSMTNNDGVDQRDALLADPSAAPARSMKDYSVEDIYVECNKTFAISMDYLNELNDTGSFPDETDKTPMVSRVAWALGVPQKRSLLLNIEFPFQCFIRCFLQKGGIVTEDDKVNKEQAIALGWVKNGETIDDCLQDMSK